MKQHAKDEKVAQDAPAGAEAARVVSGSAPLRGADAKRSVENITEWNQYLPADCVRAMVAMGWDYDT